MSRAYTTPVSSVQASSFRRLPEPDPKRILYLLGSGRQSVPYGRVQLKPLETDFKLEIAIQLAHRGVVQSLRVSRFWKSISLPVLLALSSQSSCVPAAQKSLEPSNKAPRVATPKADSEAALFLFNNYRQEPDPRFSRLPERLSRAELLPHTSVSLSASPATQSVRFYLNDEPLGLDQARPFSSAEISFVPKEGGVYEIKAVGFMHSDGTGPVTETITRQLTVVEPEAHEPSAFAYRSVKYFVTDTNVTTTVDADGNYVDTAGAVVLSRDDVVQELRGEEQGYLKTMTSGAPQIVFAFQLLVPNNYDRKAAYPLLVHLHHGWHIFRGTDNDGASLTREPLFSSEFSLIRGAVAARYPCIILLPQLPEVTIKDGVTQEWGAFTQLDNETGTVQMAETPSEAGRRVLFMVERLRDGNFALGDQVLHVDPGRVYLTGHSMGGLGSWDLLMRKPSLWAGAIVMAGYADHRSLERIKGIPIWAFHHKLDAYNPVQGTRQLARLISSPPLSGTELRYTELDFDTGGAGDQAHFRTPEAVFAENTEALDWLFSQAKGTKKGGLVVQNH